MYVDLVAYYKLGKEMPNYSCHVGCVGIVVISQFPRFQAFSIYETWIVILLDISPTPGRFAYTDLSA